MSSVGQIPHLAPTHRALPCSAVLLSSPLPYLWPFRAATPRCSHFRDAHYGRRARDTISGGVCAHLRRIHGVSGHYARPPQPFGLVRSRCTLQPHYTLSHSKIQGNCRAIELYVIFLAIPWPFVLLVCGRNRTLTSLHSLGTDLTTLCVWNIIESSC